MKIEATKVVVGVAVGGIDEVFVWRDQEAGRIEPFRTVQDWGRTALTALGYLGQAFNFYPGIAAPLAQSQVPLFTKSVISAIRHQQAGVGVAEESNVSRVAGYPMVSRPPVRELTTHSPAMKFDAASAISVRVPDEEWAILPGRGDL